MSHVPACVTHVVEGTSSQWQSGHGPAMTVWPSDNCAPPAWPCWGSAKPGAHPWVVPGAEGTFPGTAEARGVSLLCKMTCMLSAALQTSHFSTRPKPTLPRSVLGHCSGACAASCRQGCTVSTVLPGSEMWLPNVTGQIWKRLNHGAELSAVGSSTPS